MALPFLLLLLLLLSDSTLLAHPDMSQPFTLHLDARADALDATCRNLTAADISAC